MTLVTLSLMPLTFFYTNLKNFLISLIIVTMTSFYLICCMIWHYYTHKKNFMRDSKNMIVHACFLDGCLLDSCFLDGRFLSVLSYINC